eukprot:jgi/Chlat1/4354/Chrsp29S04505
MRLKLDCLLSCAAVVLALRACTAQSLDSQLEQALRDSRAAPELPKGGGPCADDWDCSLGGVCNDGKCVCDPTWTGASCATLHLMSVDRSRMGYRPDAEKCQNCTWGANAIFHEGQYHLFASELASEAGLDAWQTLSQVIYATGPAANGPFIRHGLLYPPERHNPTAVLHPDGKYLLFTIAVDYDHIGVAWAARPEGPYKDIPGSLLVGRPGQWDETVTNPGIWIHENGTVFLYYRGTDASHSEYIGLAVSKEATWNSTFERAMDKPLFRHQSEDPCVWKDSRGSFHMLTNGLPEPVMGIFFGRCCMPLQLYYDASTGVLKPKFLAGAHAWSRDGLQWSEPVLNAFNTTIRYEDGGWDVFFRRERPQVLLNAKGWPEWFYSGVMGARGVKQRDYSFTLVQRINTMPGATYEQLPQSPDEANTARTDDKVPEPFNLTSVLALLNSTDSLSPLATGMPPTALTQKPLSQSALRSVEVGLVATAVVATGFGLAFLYMCRRFCWRRKLAPFELVLTKDRV